MTEKPQKPQGPKPEIVNPGTKVKAGKTGPPPTTGGAKPSSPPPPKKS